VAAAAEAQITNWKGAQAAPTGFFSEVAFLNGDRVYSGYEVDPFSSMLSATLYATSGEPGSAAAVQTNLGLNSNTSIAVSIAYDRQGGFFSTASETLPLFESRSYIYASAALGSPVSVIGPAPGNDPDVLVHAINKNGLAVGTLAETTPVVSNAAGVSFTLPYPNAAELLGVDSRGTRFVGSSEPSPGAPDWVATIFDAAGTLLLQDSVPGVVWDIEGRYAVGQRDGKAAYWEENAQGVWQHHYLEDPPGNTLCRGRSGRG
jgi:hypothetical protein